MILIILALLTAVCFSGAEAKEKAGESLGQPHPCLASISADSPQPVRFDNLAVDVDYSPTDLYYQHLTGRVSIPAVYPRGVAEPLELRYMAMSLWGKIDSVASCHRIDSLLVYPDSSLVFFHDILPAGAVDTLVLWFGNHYDYRGDLLTTRDYHGIGAWCPVPAEIEKRFTVDVTVRVPAGLAAVAAGELQGQRRVDENTMEYSWRQKTAGDYSPVMVIDSFTVSTFERAGNEVSIYHSQRPERKVADSADRLLEAFGKYNAWFGPIPYTRINMVELDYNLTNYFSVPGFIGVPESHFGGRWGQGLLDTSAVTLRKIQSHELAHQWWAEKVYPPENRLMMEAWAEYSALKDMGAEQSVYWDQYRGQVLSAFRVAPEGLSPLVQMGGDSGKYYRKGPWVLHMLENELGEERFLGVLKAYQEQYSYRDHTLADFFGIVNSIGGKNLDWFMHEWFYKSGVPSLALRQEKLLDHTRLIVRQNRETYQIPVPLEIYHDGMAESENLEYTLAGPLDTLRLDYGDIDALIDPDRTILLDQAFEPVFAVAPFGDSPATDGVYDIRFYMDPTRELTPYMYYSVDGSGWDSLAPTAPAGTSGYGSFKIAACSPGREVSYYVKFTDSSGNEFLSPPDAPQDFHSFRTTRSPSAEEMIFVSFSDYHVPGAIGDFEPFRDYSQGLVGLDMDSRQVFGALYGVGSVAPQVDPVSRLYIAYNRYTNAVDIVDLDTWQKKASCPLQPESMVSEYRSVLRCRSAYDTKRQNYYYYDGGLYRINARTFKIDEFDSLAENMSRMPSKISYNQELDRLIVKKDRLVLVLDPQDLAVLEKIEFRTEKKLPFLDPSGKVETLEYIGDVHSFGDGHPQIEFFNLRLRYISYLSGSDLTLIDSLESSVMAERNNVSGPILDNETTVRRVKGTNIFFGTLLQNVINRFVWDVSEGTAPFVFSDDYYSVMPVAYWVEPSSGKPIGIFPSEGNTALALVDLEERKILDNSFSPFSSGVLDYLQTPRIIGIVSPEVESLSAGDLNRDNRVDVFDLIRLFSHLNGNADYSSAADLNHDGKIDVFDLLALLRLMR